MPVPVPFCQKKKYFHKKAYHVNAILHEPYVFIHFHKSYESFPRVIWKANFVATAGCHIYFHAIKNQFDYCVAIVCHFLTLDELLSGLETTAREK